MIGQGFVFEIEANYSFRHPVYCGRSMLLWLCFTKIIACKLQRTHLKICKHIKGQGNESHVLALINALGAESNCYYCLTNFFTTCFE